MLGHGPDLLAVRLFGWLALSLIATGCVPGMPNTPEGIDGSAAAILLNQSTTAVAGASAATSKKMFITTNQYTPTTNFFGPSGGNSADSRCSDEATALSYSGTYKALIVDGTNRRACTTANCAGGAGEHLDWVMLPNMQYLRPDGTLIHTTNGVGIFTTDLTNTIGAAASYWTGMASGSWNWVSGAANETCQGWFNGTAGESGKYGVSTWLDERSIAIAAMQACNVANRLLCVEQ